MLAKIKGAALQGLNAYPVEVEVDARKGFPGFQIIGLPDAVIRESKERVRTAIINTELPFPHKNYTVNLAPADTKKEGVCFDLAIALGLLVANGEIPLRKIENSIILGELSLNGEIKAVNGVLPICIMAKREGIERVLVPEANADEAALVREIEVIPVKTLAQVVGYCFDHHGIQPHLINVESQFQNLTSDELDFADVKGQAQAKRALEIAAAGGHNVLLVGSPGCGKTMLARRFPSILPPLNLAEAIEVTQIYSIAGLLNNKRALVNQRPFRNPHHTASNVALVGGGSYPKPGEVSLAHHGVLFLDEMMEFKREVLEGLRQPLEDGVVTISRALTTLTYPARFILLAALNPCYCGFLHDPVQHCSCNPSQIQRYWSRISGPLLDRIDLQIVVPRLKDDELLAKPQGESSLVVRERVIKARGFQTERLAGTPVFCNAYMGPKQIKKYCILDAAGENLLKEAIVKLKLSGRTFHRILKVARTIADLDGAETIGLKHLAESIQYRKIDYCG